MDVEHSNSKAARATRLTPIDKKGTCIHTPFENNDDIHNNMHVHPLLNYVCNKIINVELIVLLLIAETQSVQYFRNYIALL